MTSQETKVKLENDRRGEQKCQDKSGNSNFLPEYPTLDKFTQECLKKINFATKASNAIPSDRKEDWDYYGTFKGFRQVMKAQGNAIQRQMSALLKYNGIKVADLGDNVADTLEMLTEANDQLLERVSINLDEAEGVKKDTNPVLVEVSQSGLARISGSWNRNMGKPTHTLVDLSSKGSSNHLSPNNITLLAGKHVMRPQINFRNKIDNSAEPFMPKLMEKPHMKKPLSILIEYDVDDKTEFYSHPYMYEIDHLHLPTKQLEKSPESATSKYNTIEDADLIYVENVETLERMIVDLKTCSEIGVDVEHHSYRSYLGLSCLIQISTREKDYIIDPFPLWQEGTLTKLNEIFANPNIVKILHGAVNDVNWIQRDFSIYLVNMFDTHIAAKILGFPKGCLSLAFLLQHYCNSKTDKKFQLADWRIRPLADEMLQYARADTRHLIKIYHLMKNSLIEKGNINNNLLLSVYDQSSDLCRQRYEKPHIRPDSYLIALRKSKINFNSRQLSAYRELFHWRNKVAREEDESEMYVLPPHMLLKICSELPREMQGIIACCNPVPPFVKQNLHLIHQIVFKAREQPLTSVPDILNSSSVVNTDPSVNAGLCQSSSLHILENPLKCSLDLSPFQQNLEDGENKLDVLLGGKHKASDTIHKNKVATSAVITKEKPALDIFLVNSQTVPMNEENNHINTFLSPFHRLQLLKPYLEAIKIKQEGSKEHQRTDKERIQSIKAHFDALTAMTTEEYSSERQEVSKNGNGNADSNNSEDSDNEGIDMLDSYNPDPGKVKALRAGMNEGRKEFRKQRQLQLQKERQQSLEGNVEQDERLVKAKSESESKLNSNKRKSNEKDLSISKHVKCEQDEGSSTVDFTNVDFSQYSGGAKKNKNDKEFNPWKELNEKQKGKMSHKRKSNFKGANKTFHYRKST